MSSYKINQMDNHLVISVDGRKVLVDSGSPLTFGKTDGITLLGANYRVRENYAGLTIEKILEFLGFDIDLILGSDILNNLNYKIDLSNSLITLSNEPMPLEDGFELPLSFIQGVPVIRYSANGSEVTAFFDTGAKVSYLTKDTIGDLQPIEEVDDFHPLIGKFRTKIYNVPVTIGNSGNVFKLGEINFMLNLVGIKSILGNEFLRKYIVSVSKSANKFWCKTC